LAHGSAERRLKGKSVSRVDLALPVLAIADVLMAA